MKNITIAGNCTKDAEMRTTQNGTNVVGFTVAVNGFANGEKTTDFFDVSIWGKRGEAAMQFANKGAKICVTGELGTREYNGKTYLTVRGSDFTPMGGGQQSSDSGQRPQRQEPQGRQPTGWAGDELDQDEVPF